MAELRWKTLCAHYKDAKKAWRNAKEAYENAIKKGREAYKENIEKIKKYWADQWEKAKKELDKFDDEDDEQKASCQNK